MAAALPLLPLALAACAEGRAPGRDFSDPSLRLEGSAATLDGLGRRVLSALVAGDSTALQQVRLTEHQHNDIVWPELPASAPEVHFPIDVAWSNIEGRNRAAITRISRIYGDAPLVFRRVECRGEAQAFRSFEVLTDCWVVFTRGGSKEPWEARLFEDVLVRGGGYKLFRYYGAEPRRYAAVEHRGSPSASAAR